MKTSTLQSNPVVRDELTEEEFYLFPEMDISCASHTITIGVSPIRQYGYHVLSNMAIQFSKFPIKYRDN